MNAVSLPSDKSPRLQRTSGAGRIVFKQGAGIKNGFRRTELERLFQEGSAHIRLPEVHEAHAEAVLINSAGGLTGGDHLEWAVEAGAGTESVITTQSFEKIYRRLSGEARITTRINIGEHARVDWLPQETILFNHSALKRELHVEMAETSRFVALEAVILGRAAMGESVKSAIFHDRWRITKAGNLVHAEDLRLTGEIEDCFRKTALLNGNKAFASLVYIGPEDDDQMKLVTKKAGCGESLSSGITTFNGKIVVRLVAPDGYALRHKLVSFLHLLRDNKPLPKVWSL